MVRSADLMQAGAAGLMTDENAEDPGKLLKIISISTDFPVLIWAAGALNACLLKVAPVADYKAAFEEFGLREDVEKYLPAGWVGDKTYASPPPDAANIIAWRIVQLDASHQPKTDIQAMEACTWLLASLLELVRDKHRQDGEIVRAMLLADSHKVKRLHPDDLDIEMTGFRGALISTMRALESDTDNITTSRDVAYLNGALILAHLVEGDPELASVLQRCKVPELVCSRSFYKASLSASELYRRKLPLRWEAFATTSSQLLEAILSANPVIQGLDVQAKALLVILEKSFNLKKDTAVLPYAATVVQMVHLSTFKALLYIALAMPSEAKKMIPSKALLLSAELLKIKGAHEEAIFLVFDFIAALLAVSKNPQQDSRDANLPSVIEKMLDRCRGKEYVVAPQHPDSRALDDDMPRQSMKRTEHYVDIANMVWHPKGTRSLKNRGNQLLEMMKGTSLSGGHKYSQLPLITDPR
eukprot:TRINITY_DN5094_c0_g1_i2.p1 TRINITY_DN5094_c0_g1~~TRINITY_DN5094_c0_g1_i2.p1  ORF type:complete len:470 (-),score=99.91 TRINITY_DN5094_c0_g1_i2:18-1427(-)